MLGTAVGAEVEVFRCQDQKSHQYVLNSKHELHMLYVYNTL